MTPKERQLVRESFPAVQEIAGPLSLLFYGRLFELDPSLRPMFRGDLALQGRKLMDMLTAAVENLDRLENLTPALHAMGQRHAAYGVLPEHYETVTRALIWSLGRALDSDFQPDVKAAWLAVIQAIGGQMMAGAARLHMNL